MQSYSHFFSKHISVYAIFNDQSFNDTLTNDIVSFEQLGLFGYFSFAAPTPALKLVALHLFMLITSK